jgi:hypothetical protein
VPHALATKLKVSFVSHESFSDIVANYKCRLHLASSQRACAKRVCGTRKMETHRSMKTAGHPPMVS